MATKSVTIRMDEGLKREAEELFNEMGINMTTAFTMFAKTAVRQRKIPFEITGDPFYNPANMERLKKTIDNIGKTQPIVKTIEELREFE